MLALPAAVRDSVTVGSVLSYLKVALVPLPVFPALSVQFREMVKPVPSGPLYTTFASHVSMPLVASVLVEAENVTGALYQPLESGARPGSTFTTGFVSSNLNVAVAVPVFPATSSHVLVTDAVGLSGVV